ncbi:MAG TPA: chitobiase/beta-hexosaminidase C-terminal domain-containing protein, partial [Gaiellaceae bacterium]
MILFSLLSRVRVPLAITAAIAATSAVAWAYWTVGAAAGSTGVAAAATVNGGATPTASVTTTGREVAVSWGASTLSNGNAVSGYVVKRYPSGGGVPTISPVGSCSGTVASTSCTEDDVPTGTWVYTVTPAVASWRGAESATSGVVTVAAATLTLNGSPFGNAAFTPAIANATGAITGFAGGENVTYRLDAGTALTGSPTAVGADGSATITALGIPKSAGDGAHSVSVLGDAAYVPSTASAGIVIDTTAPTVSAQLAPSPNAAGWNNTSPVSVALAADDNGASGVGQIKYTTDGSDPTTSGTAHVYSGSPFFVASEGTTTVKYCASDVAGNVSSVQTQLVRIDISPPVNGVSLTNVSGGVYPTGSLTDGTTVYYRGVAAGSFRITNAVSDAVSGPASSETSPLAGGSNGWSHTASLVSTPSGGPYVSGAFGWNAGTASSPAETVTGHDVADNFSGTTLNFADDSSGPSGGSVDGTGLGGSGGRYATSTTLTVSFSKGTDAASGVAATGARLLRASATLTSDGLGDGTCGAYGSFGQIGSGDPTSPYTDDAAGGIATGHCYRYEYVAADNVGNTTTYSSGDIKVDTTGPSAPAVTLSSATGNTYINGSTVYINSQAGKAGSFQASATS